MVVAHHHEIVHRRYLNFKSTCHFASSQDKAYRTSLHHITSNLATQQRRISLTQTHLGSSRTIPLLQRTMYCLQTSGVNVLENKPIVKEEESKENVLVIDGSALQTTEGEEFDELVQQ